MYEVFSVLSPVFSVEFREFRDLLLCVGHGVAESPYHLCLTARLPKSCSQRQL